MVLGDKFDVVLHMLCFEMVNFIVVLISWSSENLHIKLCKIYADKQYGWPVSFSSDLCHNFFFESQRVVRNNPMSVLVLLLVLKANHLLESQQI